MLTFDLSPNYNANTMSTQFHFTKGKIHKRIDINQLIHSSMAKILANGGDWDFGGNVVNSTKNNVQF